MIFACFQSAGTDPVSIDCWKMKHKNGAIADAASLRTRIGIKSGPVALDGLIFCSNLVTPSISIVTFGMSGISLWPRDGNVGFSSVKTLMHCLLRISAFCFASVIFFPSDLRMGIPEVSLRLALMYCQKPLVMRGLVFSLMTSSSPMSRRFLM